MGGASFCTLWLSGLPAVEGSSAAERIAGKMACWPDSSDALRSLGRNGVKSTESLGGWRVGGG